MGTTVVAYLLFPFLALDGIRPMQAAPPASDASAELRLNGVAACFPFLVHGSHPMQATPSASDASAEIRLNGVAACFPFLVHGSNPMQTNRPASAPPAELTLKGVAAWYGDQFQGRRTANGETFDLHAYTAAHRSLPFGTLVRVRHPCNGRCVIVRINDRGPYGGGRIIDLSQAAAREIGIYRKGRCKVELQVLAADARPGPPAVAPKE